MKTKAAAVVTIKDAPNMSARGRKAVAKWLKRQADFLLSDHKNLSKRFTARYLYV